ncbi:MAG: SMP-30/gluconolactonase/LRE family protein [Caulobacterales bacterium]
MLKGLIRIVVVLGVLALLAYGGVRLALGGGKPYPGVTTRATVAPARITTPISLPFPPGMVAASSDGRIFYTYHMLHKPERFSPATVFEWVNGEGRPFPNVEMQKDFVGAMGVTADRQGRLWIIKPGALAGRATELIAIDMKTGAKLVQHSFAKGEAGFAQDMRVSPDGATVYLADTGVFRFTPASLIVFDVATQKARTVLKGNATVSAQDWVIRKTNGQPYKLAFGALTFLAGVDGIALSVDGAWLYYATMSHDSLYRIPTAALRDESLNDATLAKQIEFVGKKPMSDGIEMLADNSVIVTDVENGGLVQIAPDGKLTTLTTDAQGNWADSVTVAPDGAIWFTDSRLTDLIDQFATPSDEATMRARGPHKIYRIAPAG